MAAIATLPVLFATGIHSARPAAGDVGSGGLYSCTTHSLVYQTDGSTWTTWASLAGSGLTDPMTTRGDVIIRNASNVTARLGIGSTGKVLQSDGTDISWQTPAGGSGALILLEQHTASSSATLDFTTCITSTYDRYWVTLHHMMPATNGVNLWLRFSTNAGSSYDTSSIYDYHHMGWASSTPAASGANSQAQMLIQFPGNTIGNAVASEGYNGGFYIIDPLSTTYRTRVSEGADNSTEPGGVLLTGAFSGKYDSTTAVDAFRIMFSSGNITAGIVRVYGVAK